MQIHLVPDRFAGKTAVVTGAAGGIGEATAKRLAAEGANVLCLDLQADAVGQTVADITAAGGSAAAKPTDVSDSAACWAAIGEAVERWGALHALCNVAGVLKMSHTHEETDQSWQLMVDVNLTGTFYLSRAAIPHLLETEGAIVNVSSTAGVMGQAYLAAYSASKHGVIGLTKSMAVEYARQRVRVNAVCPGGVDTSMTQEIEFPDDVNVNLIMRAALAKENCTPDDVANMIAWLASDEATYVNGSVLSVDGGVAAG